MPDDDNSDTTDRSMADGETRADPAPARSDEVHDWGAPLWDDTWEGQTGLFGDAHLCAATKKWADGTVDVLVAHDPHADDGMPTVYAHRHGQDVTPLTVHGPADDMVKTVTNVWGPPQEETTESRGD